ncbi:MAG: hypothetical protein ACRDQ1_08505, partial [Sciscionella sp.]
MTVAATPTGCALSTLVERVRPVTLEVLTAPAGDPVTVRGAVIEDLGDPLPDLPGALLLLVGAAADPELVMTSLRRAAARSFAGVIIKARRRDLTEMLRAAADLSLAVLTINDELSWRELGALLDAALGPFVGTSDTPAAGVGDELFAIADAVAGTIGGSVAIEDLGQHVLAYSSVPGQRIDPLRSQGILDRRVPDLPVNADMYRSVLNAPGIVRFPTEGDELARAAIGIRAGTLPLGTLWVIEGDEGLTAEGDRALAEGAQLAALHMLRARSAGELDQHLRGELLRALLEGAVGSQAAAHRLGLAVGQAQALLALGPSQPFPPTGPPLIPDVAQQVRSQCAALRPDAIVTAVHRAVYVLIAGTRAGDAAARLAASLLGALDRGST